MRIWWISITTFISHRPSRTTGTTPIHGRYPKYGSVSWPQNNSICHQGNSPSVHYRDHPLAMMPMTKRTTTTMIWRMKTSKVMAIWKMTKKILRTRVISSCRRQGTPLTQGPHPCLPPALVVVFRSILDPPGRKGKALVSSPFLLDSSSVHLFLPSLLALPLLPLSPLSRP